jgi:hypothetical protein
MNRIRKEEVGDKRAALQEMHDQGVTSYRHAGVELVRVPGEEVLRVRKSKEDATAASPAKPAPENPGGDIEPAGQVDTDDGDSGEAGD